MIVAGIHESKSLLIDLANVTKPKFKQHSSEGSGWNSDQAFLNTQPSPGQNGCWRGAYKMYGKDWLQVCYSYKMIYLHPGVGLLIVGSRASILYTKNVAMATTMTYFSGAFKELSSSTIPNYLSQNWR